MARAGKSDFPRPFHTRSGKPACLPAARLRWTKPWSRRKKSRGIPHRNGNLLYTSPLIPTFAGETPAAGHHLGRGYTIRRGGSSWGHHSVAIVSQEDPSMMSVLLLVLAVVLALLGHTSFWVGLVNRMHSRAWPESLLRGLTLGCVLCWGVLGAGFLRGIIASSLPEVAENVGWAGWFMHLAWPWQVYGVFCWLVAGRNLWAWWWRYVLHRPPNVLLSQQVASIYLPAPAQKPPGDHPLVWVPQNEILRMELTRREIQLAHLPPELDGLCLLHLSDLHFTGRVGQDWFRQLMEICAQLNPDLITFTGDFLDTMDCLGWIPKVFAPLNARWGVYFILGNHDWRLDWPRIRAEMAQMGFVWLGGRWTLLPEPGPHRKPAGLSSKSATPCSGSSISPPDTYRTGSKKNSVGDNRDGRILLAGNELPWIGPAPDLSTAPPPASEGGPVRILLAHSPDQLRWARKHQFDFMLAGHTHGGQIQIPLVGPILTPSRSGVRYSGGVFHEPPTVLHVTRGISAEWPLRWNCPPEVVLLVLRSGFCLSKTS